MSPSLVGCQPTSDDNRADVGDRFPVNAPDNGAGAGP